MECFHCGQENDDEATYCKQCGKRVDGKMECPSCKELIDCDSLFCEYCGQDLQENYDEETAFEDSPLSNKLSGFKPDLRKANEICIGAFSMATVFFSLLFAFFLGVKAFCVSFPDAEGLLSIKTDLNIFYYLEECYNNLSELNANYPTYFVANYSFITAVGTILSISIIVTVVVSSIISIVRFVNYCTGRTIKSFSGSVIATYASYIVGVTLFYAFNVLNLESGETALSFKLNEYTVAGLILSTLFMILTTVCRTASLDKLLSTSQNLYKTCFTALDLVLLAFIAVLVASPSISLYSKENMANVSLNIFSAMTMLVYIVVTKDFSDSYSKEIIYSESASSTSNNFPVDVYAQLVVALIIQIAIIIMAINMIVTLLKDLSNNDRQSSFKSLAVSIVMSVFSIGFLIITTTAGNGLIEYIGNDDKTISFNSIPLILLVIVSVISLTLEIVHIIINARIKRRLE